MPFAALAQLGAHDRAQRQPGLAAQRVVEARDGGADVARQLGRRAQGEARERGAGGGLRPLAGDVADHDHPAARAGEDVVEVAADLVELAGRPVQDGGGPAGHLGQLGREQAVLERAGDRGAAAVAARVVDRDAGAAADLLRELALGPAELAPGLGVCQRQRADRLGADAQRDPQRALAGGSRLVTGRRHEARLAALVGQLDRRAGRERRGERAHERAELLRRVHRGGERLAGLGEQPLAPLGALDLGDVLDHVDDPQDRAVLVAQRRAAVQQPALRAGRAHDVAHDQRRRVGLARQQPLARQVRERERAPVLVEDGVAVHRVVRVGRQQLAPRCGRRAARRRPGWRRRSRPAASFIVTASASACRTSPNCSSATVSSLVRPALSSASATRPASTSAKCRSDSVWRRREGP